MIDILIIVIFIWVVISNLLKAFTWFQEKFNIYGTTINQSQPQDINDQKQIKQERKQINVSNMKLTKKIPQSQAQKVKDLQKETRKISPSKQGFSPLKQAETIKRQTIENNNYPLKRTQQIQITSQKPARFPLPQSFTLLQTENKTLLQKIKQLSKQKDLLKQKLQQNNQILNYKIQQFNLQNSQLKTKLSLLKDQYQNEKNNVEILKNQLYERIEQSDNLIKELREKLEKNLIEDEKNFENRIQLQRLKEECERNANGKKEHKQIDTNTQQIQLTYNIINQNVQLINQLEKKNQQQYLYIQELQKKKQQIKHELEFCQRQIQNLTQNQNNLKQQNQKLKQHAKIKSKAQISITDVTTHPQYIRVKELLTKYQNGQLLSSSRQKSINRSQFTPRGERTSTSNSRISQRRSFVGSKNLSQLGNGDKNETNQGQLFSQCNFLNVENKSYLLQEIKKIKKLSIKKTKLIFKLEKLHPTNPHQFIDNIPNIIILIELTNKKILGAFSQNAFTKDQLQSLSSQKSSPLRSRIGSNKALIIDLTNKKSFSNTSSQDAIVYDQNALIWGKNELVIKNDEPTLLYSSFGQKNSVYWDNKYTLEQFLGGNQIFQRINQYQIHRVYIS